MLKRSAHEGHGQVWGHEDAQPREWQAKEMEEGKERQKKMERQKEG